MKTTNVHSYVRTYSDGTIQYVNGHSRGVGSGYTADGQRLNRSQLEYTFINQTDERKAKLAKFHRQTRTVF